MRRSPDKMPMSTRPKPQYKKCSQKPQPGAVKRQNGRTQNAQTPEQNGKTGQIMHKGSFRDANYNGEVRNAVTSSFARQAGTDSFFRLLLIYPYHFHRMGFLCMPNTMVKSKILLLPVCLAQQEGSSFSCIFLIDPYRFHSMWVSQNAAYNGEAQNVAHIKLPGSLILIIVSAPLLGSIPVQKRIELLNIPLTRPMLKNFRHSCKSL